ncbi:hypothetical protein PM082_004406 [Marasmius tenuissimus]|nr:hypothetical protein PM082_004406 [Marasmius tenuissimus]
MPLEKFTNPGSWKRGKRRRTRRDASLSLGLAYPPEFSEKKNLQDGSMSWLRWLEDGLGNNLQDHDSDLGYCLRNCGKSRIA